MELKKIHSNRFEVMFYELDQSGHVSIKSIFNYLQGTADRHSRNLGTSVNDFSSSGKTWVYSKLKLEMESYPGSEGSVTVKTWRSKAEDFTAYREFTIRDENSIIIGGATAALALIDINTRKPVAIPQEIMNQFSPEEGHAIGSNFDRISLPEAFHNTKPFYVRLSDLDPNGHVNNAAYVDYLTEAVPENIQREYQIKSIEINFRAEAFYGDLLRSNVFCKKNNEEKIFLHSLLRNDDKTETTRAITMWKKRMD